ncbi:MAG: DUF1566 domain-containing protein [Sulfurovaceae bacterium]|nr:DUF1566 domain-containing protein [Sulfurovaceae bacterium]
MILSFESVQKYCASPPPIKRVYRLKHSFCDTFFAKGDKEWRQTFYYWSSTTNHNDHNNAWMVYFGYGNTNNNNKNNSNYVRCVRAG